MTLEQAIKHCWDVHNKDGICKKCQDEHLQLYHWLTELYNRRNADKKVNKLRNKVNEG
jgi:hypothetical protein